MREVRVVGGEEEGDMMRCCWEGRREEEMTQVFGCRLKFAEIFFPVWSSRGADGGTMQVRRSFECSGN